MKVKMHLASPEHEVAYQDVVALVSRHKTTLTPMEILAVAANMIGKLVAMQDQRTVTPEAAMEIVASNIEAGNQQAIEELQRATGGTA